MFAKPAFPMVTMTMAMQMELPTRGWKAC